MSAELIAYVQDLPRLQRPMDILNALHDRIAVPEGVNVYGAWYTDPHIVSFKPGVNVFAHKSVQPAYWAEFSKLHAKHGSSPLARLARLQLRPMTWTEGMRRFQLTGTDRWMFDLAQRHGLRDGMHCARGAWLIAYWSEKVFRPNTGTRETLCLAAGYAGGYLDDMTMAKRALNGHAVALSPSELKALLRYSYGDEPQQIARRMDVAINTVHTFLERACKKLKARNRPHAVRIAKEACLI